MRLDKYLKVSRLIKRRTVANDACDAGRVSVNDKPARASYEVKTGDKLVLSLGAHKLSVEVLEINEHATKDDAMSLYRVIEQN
jgi:ribosomal 50S subunit-recycling heat shock protein